MSEAWSREEVEAAVADYFDMLAKELRGEAYNKAEHNRQLLRMLSAERRRGSIEKKHQNISAVLIELGYPYIDGYKPLPNYQQLLVEVLQERLSAAADLREIVAANVAEEASASPPIADILSILVRPPVFHRGAALYERPARRIAAPNRNYLETEARNSLSDALARNWFCSSSTSGCGARARALLPTGWNMSPEPRAMVWGSISGPLKWTGGTD